MTKWKHNVTKENMVALKTVSLNNPQSFSYYFETF